MVPMKTYITLLLLICQVALSAEIEINDCVKIKARVDVDALNSLNKQALEILPYTLSESSDPNIQTVTQEEMAEKYSRLNRKGTPDKYAQYVKLVEDIHLFSLSGGFTISSIDQKVRENKVYYDCPFISRDKTQNYAALIQQIPHLSPVLERAFARALLEGIHAYQEKIINPTASNLYFWVFGARSWGDRNIRESQEYSRIMRCVIDQVDESAEVDTSCEEMKKTEQYKAYRTFLSTAVVNYAFIINYTSRTDNKNRYGFYGDIFTDSNPLMKKLDHGIDLGKAAFSIANAGYSVLSNYYEQNFKSAPQ